VNTNVADIKIVKSIAEAPNYHKDKSHAAASVEKFVVVRNGTQEGRSTVDICFVDAQGNKFVAMMTGRLIRSVATAIGDEG